MLIEKYLLKLLSENIYFEQSRFQIRAAIIDANEIHFNVYHPDTMESMKQRKQTNRLT